MTSFADLYVILSQLPLFQPSFFSWVFLVRSSYNGIVGRRRLQQHQLGMEEQDCQNSQTVQTFLTKTLAHLFISKYLISTPSQYTTYPNTNRATCIMLRY